jgi:cell wall-associated NlpC family hydrolase
MTAPAVQSPHEDAEPAVDQAVDPAERPATQLAAGSESSPSRPLTSLPGAPTPVRPDTAATPATPPTTTPPGGKNTAPAPGGQPPKTEPAKTDQAATTTAPDAKQGTTTPAAATTDTTKTDTKNTAAQQDSAKADGTAKPDAAAAPTPDLNSLANLAPSLAAPMLNTAMGIPTAALQGIGQMVPSIAAAVMPTLAALLTQLGTGPAPSAPASRLSNSPDALPALGELAGTGGAADGARAETSAAAAQAAGLRAVERSLGNVLGLASAKTEDARRTLIGIISEVEGAVRAAAVQGNTPEAQALVISAMRRALDSAGTVVSAAARDKAVDAAFVRGLINQYLNGAASAGGGGAMHLQAGNSRGAAAVAAARRALGLPYVWGGGTHLGPTKGGFDCSGLTSYAVAKATGGRLILPRTTYEQIHSGRPVSMAALAPGDLIFSNFSAPGVPEHVQLYIGGGQVIEAPQRGAPVQISSVPSNAQARRVL